MTPIELRLTPKEAEVIEHRLAVTDAMAQVFGPSGDDVWGYATDEETEGHLQAVLGEIVTKLAGGGMILKFNADSSEHVLVMNELVDGNTMGGIVADMLAHAPEEKAHKKGVALRETLRLINRRWGGAGLTAQFEI
ncbi:hypothetical protein RPALISO_215 [Ruegeria phage RpAliso]|nr:hypothetical protein RPALISO_215 [Ruegeria phage RpAliso]